MSPHLWVYWLPLLAFESTLFMLATVKAFRVAQGVSKTPRVLAVLLEDSMTYFGGIFAVSIANLAIDAFARVRRIALHRRIHTPIHNSFWFWLSAITFRPHFSVRAVYAISKTSH